MSPATPTRRVLRKIFGDLRDKATESPGLIQQIRSLLAEPTERLRFIQWMEIHASHCSDTESIHEETATRIENLLGSGFSAPEEPARIPKLAPKRTEQKHGAFWCLLDRSGRVRPRPCFYAL